MISQASGINTDQPLVLAAVGQRFSAVEIPGRADFAPGGDPVLYLSDPPGIDAARRAAACSTASAQAESDAVRGLRRSGNRNAHRAIRDGVPHADFGAGTDGSVQGAAARLRAVWPGCAQAGHVRGELSAGAAAGGAQRALHAALPSRLGPAQRSASRPGAAVQRAPTSRPRRWCRI